jgi:hypothetical protein
MKNVHDDRPTTPTEDPLTIILGEIRKLATRLESLEERIERLDEPDTRRPPLASLALRSDGKVLLSVAHVEGADLVGRERWEGVVLSDTEASRVLKAMSDAADDAASHAGGAILYRKRKNDPDNESGSGEAT